MSYFESRYPIYGHINVRIDAMLGVLFFPVPVTQFNHPCIPHSSIMNT